MKKLKSALDRVALLRVIYEMHQSVSNHIDPKTLILIWDTGGSAGPTPFCSDFIDYVECDIDVRDVTKVNKVIGVGITLHKFVDIAGNNVYLPCVSYHLPSTGIRLFSQQVYHQIYGGHSIVNGDKVVMRVCEEGRPITIAIPIDRDGTNACRAQFVRVQEDQEEACSQVQVCFICDWPLSSSLGNSQNYSYELHFFTLKINKESFYSGTPALLLHQSKALDVSFHLVSWLRFGSNFRARTINFPILTLM